jgi:hypothetical protein
MRQVTSVGAGALHDVGVVRQHGVEFFDQWHHLDRELTVKALRFAPTNPGQRGAQASQRRQPDRHLHHSRQHQARAQHA